MPSWLSQAAQTNKRGATSRVIHHSSCYRPARGSWLAALASAILLLPLAGAPRAPAQQAYVKASNTHAQDYFGFNVAVSGDTMVIGAYGEDSRATEVNGNPSGEQAEASGAAYVFVQQGGHWVPQAYLKPFNSGQGDYFGVSVAISGDTVVVGAPYEDSDARGVSRKGNNNGAPNSGAAYVFVRHGTNWSQQAYLKASNTDDGDEFGMAVAISGDTVVVGAWREDSDATGVNGHQNNDSTADSGAVYVFVRTGTTWSQQAYLKASNTGSGDFFGEAVAVSGDTLVVGASRESSNATGVNGNQGNNDAYESGAAYIFVRSGTTWRQQAYVKASNTDPDDRFGQSVAVSGDTVVVGALSESSKARGVNGNQTDNSAHHAGAAYIFVRGGANWTQQAYLKASNAEADDAFGYPVSVSGDTIAVGAQTESSSAIGVNGNQRDNSAFWSGAAYVFARGGTNWIQQAYLKASNTEGGIPGISAGDIFGTSVAVSGDTVVVGAYLEDSAARGVNGDQTNNSAPDSGAAYVFTGMGLGLVSDGNGGYAARFKVIPGLSYRLERALMVTGPWDTIATSTANELGIVSFHDTNAPPSQAFYRTATP